jgi:hypothetical protein
MAQMKKTMTIKFSNVEKERELMIKIINEEDEKRNWIKITNGRGGKETCRSKSRM